ncbi:MAG TPA: AAA family ATPase [Cytophagales bacterium]|nr:AAA family ATPase [Cytophagales bacterium]
MVTEKLTHNAHHLQQEMHWLYRLIEARLHEHFTPDANPSFVYEVAPPGMEANTSIYANFVHHYQLSFAERVTLALALAPHIRPQLLDRFFAKNESYDRGFTEFGGIRGSHHGGFLPTGETVVFLIAGSDMAARFSLHSLFGNDHFFHKHNILKLESGTQDEPFLSGALQLSREFLEFFTTGEVHRPTFSMDFPARHIETDLDWDDLVLDNGTVNQIREIHIWMQYGETLMQEWGMAKKLRPGYRALFHGPPGTGKTLTACLLGKETSRDVYRVDLSMVISKYIGETEKNLSKVFDQAENKNWILFFDEADALFGKRTKVEDSHDRFANQEVSYLLQRVESYNGVVILASNQKSNMDDAFNRRFESIIEFPMPSPKERRRLWEQGFSEASTLDDGVELWKLSEQYELSGGSIMNVIRFASLAALAAQSNQIRQQDLMEGIRREYMKEGRVL